jgi:acyl transferase domain-containing protein
VAIQLGLTDLLKSWNIKPSATVGHSSGEIGAAYAAGILDLEDCMAIAYFRGQSVVSMRRNHPDLKGTMMAVGAGPQEMQEMLTELHEGKAVVACINSPSSVTISGDVAAITELQPLVEERQIFNRRLHVDVAYHSHHMELAADEYFQSIKNVKPMETTEVKFYSSLLGKLCQSHQLDADYWVQNLTSPVRFSQGLAAMCLPGQSSKPQVDILLEIGPHAALEGPVKQILKSLGGSALKTQYRSMLYRKKDAVETAMDAAASMFSMGAMLDFEAINFPMPSAKAPSLLTDIPRYPWNHSVKYWHDSRFSLKHCHRESPRRDLLGSVANYSNDLEPTWRNILRTDDMPWLRHHRMQDMMVYPMAGYMIQAIEAAADLATSRGVTFDKFELREITTSRPLIITEDTGVETNITLRPFTEGTRMSSDYWDEFRVFSWAKDRGWIEHCRGLIAAVNSTNINVINGREQLETSRVALCEKMDLINQDAQTPVEAAAFYEELESKGAGYGPTFQSMDKCRRCDSHAVTDIIVPDTAADMPLQFETSHIIHPAFLDQFIQIVWPVFGAGLGGLNTLYMPSFVQNMHVNLGLTTTTGDRLKVWGSGCPTPANPKATKFDLFATSMDGGSESLISMNGLVMTPVFDGSGDMGDEARELCYKISWEPVVKEQVVDEQMDTNGRDMDDSWEAVTTEQEVEDQSNTNEAVMDDVVQSRTELGVAIVCEPSQMAMVQMVSEALEAHMTMRPEIVTMMELVPTDKVCIMLSELATPLLATMNGEQFSVLQNIMTNAAGIIWAVSGAYQDSTNPHANMVVGMARSVRSETLLKFVTIDLSHQASDATVTHILAQVFCLTFVADKPQEGYEFEFNEREGKLLVPRVIEDEETNKHVYQETQNAAPDLQPFDQPGRPLKIAIGTGKLILQDL